MKGLCNKALLSCSLIYSLGHISPAFGVSLEETVAATLIDNPDITILINQNKAGAARVDQALAGYKPSVDIRAGIGGQRRDSPGTRASGTSTSDFTRKETGIAVEQMLFDGFATQSEVDRNRQANRAQAMELVSEAENLALRVVEVYLQLMDRDKQVELAQGNLETHKRIFRQIRLRHKQGLATSSDLSQIESRMALASSNLVNARNNLLDARAAYYAVVNHMPEGLTEPQPNSNMLPENLTSATALAKQEHPTLQAADFDIKEAEAQYKASKASFFPRFDLALDSAFNEEVDGVHGHDNDLRLMLKMRYNLYAGGRDQARKRETAFQVEEARSVKQRASRQVVEGLQLAWAAYQLLNEQKNYLNRYVRSSRNTAKAYQEQFDLGKRTLLDLLDSESELFRARQNFYRSHFDEIQARYRVLNATGQLLGSMKIELPTEWSKPLLEQ